MFGYNTMKIEGTWHVYNYFGH